MLCAIIVIRVMCHIDQMFELLSAATCLKYCPSSLLCPSLHIFSRTKLYRYVCYRFYLSFWRCWYSNCMCSTCFLFNLPSEIVTYYWLIIFIRICSLLELMFCSPMILVTIRKTRFSLLLALNRPNGT